MTTFPCRSESFATREIDVLRKNGLNISVFAVEPGPPPTATTEGLDITYRSRFKSFESVRNVTYVMLRHPAGLLKLGLLTIQLLFVRPREALILMRNVHTVSGLVRCLDAAGIERIHAYFMSWPALMGLAASRVRRCRFSIAAHARDIFVESGALKRKVRSAEFVVTCTRQGLDALRTRLPEELHGRLRLVHHCVPATALRANSGEHSQRHPKRFDLICVGRFVEKKGYGYLLMALALLKERRHIATLCMSGEGPEQANLQRLVGDLGLQATVRFTDWLPNPLMCDHILQARALVVPSIVTTEGDRDGIPNVILEAMSLGVPVLASRLPGICEVVEHDMTGLLVPPGDIEALAGTIKKILGSKRLAARLAAQASEIVTRRFGACAMAGSMKHLFGVQ